MLTEIPRGNHDDGFDFQPGHPAWFATTDGEGKRLKPTIRCNCGKFCGIRLHHVHADGTVTASFFDASLKEHPQGSPDGCDWHVWLKLIDWDGGEMLPGQE